MQTSDLKIISAAVRKDIIKMLGLAGSGYPGGNLSSTELLVWTPARRAVTDRADAPFDLAGPARAPPDPRAGAPRDHHDRPRGPTHPPSMIHITQHTQTPPE